MFKITINAKASAAATSTTVLFSKFFSTADVEKVLAAIEANKYLAFVGAPEATLTEVNGARRVVFVDTPATPHLVGLVETLLAKGIEVVVRDHHDVTSPRNPREQEIATAAERIRELCGANAVISDRATNPACSGLITAGEFGGHQGTVIIADPDPDGLTAAMKAVGVTYDGLDVDADVLDGGRASQTPDRLSANALLLTRAMASLPPFDSNRPQASDDAKEKLFADFVAMVQGDSDAKARLEKGVAVYEEGVAEAKRLLGTVTEVTPGVLFVDVTGSSRFDLATLAGAMESRPEAKVTVQKKSFGPIAGKHGGVQYSLAVVKAFQAEINLQEMLTPGFVSSPETGIISNTSFLLHVSEGVWESQVLPALRARFAV